MYKKNTGLLFKISNNLILYLRFFEENITIFYNSATQSYNNSFALDLLATYKG